MNFIKNTGIFNNLNSYTQEKGDVKMNLIDESFETKKTDRSKKIAKIILIVISILLVAIIAIIGGILYIQNSTLKLYVNGSLNEKVKNRMVI